MAIFGDAHGSAGWSFRQACSAVVAIGYNAVDLPMLIPFEPIKRDLYQVVERVAPITLASEQSNCTSIYIIRS